MLRVISNWMPESSPSVELDFHIPARVRYVRPRLDIPDYWRSGNLDTTFVEIGVLPSNGRVVAFTLTSIDGWTELNAPPLPSPSQLGVPVVDTAALQGNFTDSPGPIALGIGRDFLAIELVPGAKVVRELYDHGLRFLIGEHEAWVGLVLTGCDAHGLSEVRAGIRPARASPR